MAGFLQQNATKKPKDIIFRFFWVDAECRTERDAPSEVLLRASFAPEFGCILLVLFSV